jgi:hypothetical protein
MLVSKGERIIFSKGHVIGSVSDYIAEGKSITPHELRIDFDAASINASNDGHACRKCGERVTECRDGAYRILTERGWIGMLP